MKNVPIVGGVKTTNQGSRGNSRKKGVWVFHGIAGVERGHKQFSVKLPSKRRRWGGIVKRLGGKSPVTGVILQA